MLSCRITMSPIWTHHHHNPKNKIYQALKFQFLNVQLTPQILLPFKKLTYKIFIIMRTSEYNSRVLSLDILVSLHVVTLCRSSEVPMSLNWAGVRSKHTLNLSRSMLLNWSILQDHYYCIRVRRTVSFNLSTSPNVSKQIHAFECNYSSRVHCFIHVFISVPLDCIVNKS